MKHFLFQLCLLFSCAVVYGQGENNIWALNRNNGIDFNGSSPVAITTAMNSNWIQGSATVCTPGGALLFYSNGGKIWDRNHNLMPNGSLAPNLPLAARQGTVIVPIPNDVNRYYVFSLQETARATFTDLLDINSRLYYTIVDMSLNNGLGDVVPGEKWKLLDNYLAEKMIAIKGDRCNVWLLVRSKKTNQYKSYEITRGGINPQPVLSTCGTFPLESYIYCPIKVSPDRRKLAASLSPKEYNLGIDVGIETYDFDPLTGIVSNPQVIDNGLNLSFYSVNTHYYFDLCFSPNNSKLYATSLVGAWPSPPQDVFQYDMSQPNAAAIQASKTPVFSSQSLSYYQPGYYRFYDLELGPNGKLYCSSLYQYDFIGPGPISVINAPDQPGMLSNPVLDVLPMLHTGIPNGPPYLNFPNKVPERPMFVVENASETKQVTVCAFSDGYAYTLWADTPAMNFVWDDGSTAASRTVYESGTYYVRYQLNACTDKTDTLHVTFERLPLISWDSNACYGMQMGKAYASTEDSIPVVYTWRNEAGIIDVRQKNRGDTITGLNPGNYSVQLTTAFGCDTTIKFTVAPYPGTDLMVTPGSATIRYGDSIQLHASGALYYAWWPSGTVSNDTIPNPFVRPLAPTVFTVLGLNEYGCRDTAIAEINIDYALPDFIPNAFSPNGDGVNDVFKIENITYQRLVEFRIFNRWGQQIFETTNPQKGWDGTQDGKACPTDTYYYLISLNYPDGKMKVFKGDVILVR
jgi:gliding motility-associated-like protein